MARQLPVKVRRTRGKQQTMRANAALAGIRQQFHVHQHALLAQLKHPAQKLARCVIAAYQCARLRWSFHPVFFSSPSSVSLLPLSLSFFSLYLFFFFYPSYFLFFTFAFSFVSLFHPLLLCQTFSQQQKRWNSAIAAGNFPEEVKGGEGGGGGKPPVNMQGKGGIFPYVHRWRSICPAFFFLSFFLILVGKGVLNAFSHYFAWDGTQNTRQNVSQNVKIFRDCFSFG